MKRFAKSGLLMALAMALFGIHQGSAREFVSATRKADSEFPQAPREPSTQRHH
jgi:hypothetical protein